MKKDIESAFQEAGTLLAPWAVETTHPEPDRMDVVIAPENLTDAIERLSAAHFFLVTITGLDLGGEAGMFELLYHLRHGPPIVTLRVQVPHTQPAVDSICRIVPSASFYEREIIEMFGITFAGTPNTDRLFLPDEWPEGVYPLRKDFDPETLAATIS